MSGDLTADGRYLVTTDAHVFTLDPGSGAVEQGRRVAGDLRSPRSSSSCGRTAG